MTDTPQISQSRYASNTTALNSVAWGVQAATSDWHASMSKNAAEDFLNIQQLMEQQRNQPEIMASSTRRIVQVFIADPNENVPLEHSVLYRGDQKLTDLTDTELFFEVPMSDILKIHNDKRVKFVDKEATKRAGKDVLLDAVKIRDLKMVVVTVAQF